MKHLNILQNLKRSNKRLTDEQIADFNKYMKKVIREARMNSMRANESAKHITITKKVQP